MRCESFETKKQEKLISEIASNKHRSSATAAINLRAIINIRTWSVDRPNVDAKKSIYIFENVQRLFRLWRYGDGVTVSAPSLCAIWIVRLVQCRHVVDVCEIVWMKLGRHAIIEPNGRPVDWQPTLDAPAASNKTTSITWNIQRSFANNGPLISLPYGTVNTI